MKMASPRRYLPLWFNQPDGAMLFQFLKQPISYHQYTGRKRERIGVNDRMQWEDLGGGTARRAAFHGAFPASDGLFVEFEPLRGVPRLSRGAYAL